MSEYQSKIKNCYCTLWLEKPETLESQGLPRGFCGYCSVCGKPGHLRHAPGCHPYTDAWCDSCFKTVWLLNNLQCVSLIGIFIPMFWHLWYVSGILLCIFIGVTWKIKKNESKKLKVPITFNEAGKKLT